MQSTSSERSSAWSESGEDRGRSAGIRPNAEAFAVTWYTPLEMAKRIGFYHSMQAVGSMMSGAIQSGINSSLDGTHGIAGWQWTFIINCIMTLCIAVAG
jgi:hypothetical protein